jgi:hypothetical protein
VDAIKDTSTSILTLDAIDAASREVPVVIVAHVPRKCGSVLFARTQKMWECVVCTYPENVGVCCLHVPRKCGSVLFARTQKIILGMGVCYLQVPRKCGCVSFSRSQVQRKFWAWLFFARRRRIKIVADNFLENSTG